MTTHDTPATPRPDIATVLADAAAPYRTGTHRRHEYVRSVVRSAILTGALPAGTKLPEAAVIDILNISRTPVREAFRLLEGEGLIAYSPSRGVVVRGLDHQDLNDICEMLETLEPLAARLAAERADPTHIADLKSALELMQFHAEREQWANVTTEGIRFHHIVYEASGNARLKATLTDLREYVRVAREQALASPGRGPKSVDEHAQLYAAIEQHDPDKADNIARIHIHNFRERAGLLT